MRSGVVLFTSHLQLRILPSPYLDRVRQDLLSLDIRSAATKAPETRSPEPQILAHES